ncbi:uncharacterized protein TNCV_3953301 [Trichonephila clavipes]|nr:uncharacterized protein TNCV_3953301 [Trichonephila clavipes]
MPRLQKVFKKRKGKYYPRKNTITSKVSTTERDCKLNAQAEHAHDSKQSCAKEKKIPDLNESFSSFGDSVGILNAIMNLNILAFVFKNEVHCKMCNSGLDMQVLKGKSGLAITFVLKCFACPYRVEFSSSNFHEGTQIATINTRFVYAMRSIGKGAEAGRMFCGVMNLPQPPTRFSPYGKRILNAAKLVYEDSIQNAAKEAICENEGNKNIAVAADGTWQKRGYTSLNGVVTVTSIDTGKVIDVDILSKYCACKNLPFHEKDCKRNYVGSSGAMEIQVYWPCNEAHGNKITPIKSQLKGQILSDGKCLSGKNRLTEHEMDNLQSYYGSAIRRNHSSVQNMRQAIWPIFLHKLSTDEYPQHGFCPIGEDSWWGFKKAEASGKSYKHKNSLPVAVVEAMRPIFRDLSNPDLLKKCLHGKTQNPNESFQNVVWSRVPKATFVQIETLSLGVYDAVCSFNYGNVSKLKIFQKMGVEPGEFSVSVMKLLDRERLMKSIYAFSGSSKKIRKDKRKKRKKEDNIKKNKVKTGYSAGSFDEDINKPFSLKELEIAISHQKNSSPGEKEISIFQKTINLLQELCISKVDILQWIPPPPIYENRKINIYTHELPFQNKDLPDDIVQNMFNDYFQPKFNNNIIIETDGSKNTNQTSIGILIPKKKIQQNFILKEMISIFTAEAIAICTALKNWVSGTENYIILTDSLSVLKSIRNINRKSNTIILNLSSTLHQCLQIAQSITFIWVPAHRGIGINEVDKLAKASPELWNIIS